MVTLSSTFSYYIKTVRSKRWRMFNAVWEVVYWWFNGDLPRNIKLKCANRDQVESEPMQVTTRSQYLMPRNLRNNQRFENDVRLVACAVIVKNTIRRSKDVVELASQENFDFEPLLLLITSSKNSNAWILPKGGWELDETAKECALREAEEEAGVRQACMRWSKKLYDRVNRIRLQVASLLSSAY